MHVLEIEDLKVSYDAPASPGTLFSQNDPLQKEFHWELEPVSLFLNRGEGCAIIGDNGAGKSSFLRAVAGLIPIQEGRIEIPENTLAVLDLNLLFHPDFSGYENLYMMNACHGRNDQELDLVMESLIAFSGMEEFVHRPVREYSTGMRLRLGISYVLFQDFDLLIIDEVLAVGDLAFQRQCLARMRDLIGQGKSVLLTSHNMLEVSSLCSQVILLDRGKVLSKGSPDEVLADYFTRSEEKGKFAQLIQDRQIDESNSGKVDLKAVRFLDCEDREINHLQTGEDLQVEILFHVNEELIEDPLFRLEFFRNDGLMASAINNYRLGFHCNFQRGEAAIRLKFQKFSLLAGVYYISVSIWPDEYASMVSGEAYVHHDRAYEISIYSERSDGAGIAAVQAEFKLLG